jgi:hypothetical protein
MSDRGAVWIPYAWGIERTRRESLDHGTQVAMASEITRLVELNERDLDLVRGELARRRRLRYRLLARLRRARR